MAGYLSEALSFKAFTDSRNFNECRWKFACSYCGIIIICL